MTRNSGLTIALVVTVVLSAVAGGALAATGGSTPSVDDGSSVQTSFAGIADPGDDSMDDNESDGDSMSDDDSMDDGNESMSDDDSMSDSDDSMDDGNESMSDDDSMSDSDDSMDDGSMDDDSGGTLPGLPGFGLVAGLVVLGVAGGAALVLRRRE